MNKAEVIYDYETGYDFPGNCGTIPIIDVIFNLDLDGGRSGIKAAYKKAYKEFHNNLIAGTGKNLVMTDRQDGHIHKFIKTIGKRKWKLANKWRNPNTKTTNYMWTCTDKLSNKL